MRRWIRGATPWATVVAVVVMVCWWVPALAAPVARNPAEEAALEQKLAARDAGAVPLFRAATAASDADRMEEAQAGFQRVLERVPDHGPSLRRLARLTSIRKQHAEALKLARRALEVDPVPESKQALALVLDDSGDPTVKGEARALAQQGYREKPEERGAAILAQFALQDGDVVALSAAVDDLRKYAPDGLAANYFGALVQLMRNQPEQADRLLQRAVAAGLPAEAAAQLREQTGLAQHFRFWRYIKLAVLVFAAWLVGLLALYLIGRLLSARTLAAIDRAAGDGDQLKQQTGRLRAIYSRLISVAAAYYYLSIPFVVVSVLVGAGAVVLGFMFIGWLPIYLLGMVVIGALFSVWAVLRSLLAVRVREEDPGRKLAEAEAPALWALLREVAARVGTRPVDSVYLTPGTEIGVAETGPLRARLADRGHRFLVLGIGGLDGFSLSGFRAVLAHEYGHFSHRDTAGGDRASAVVGALFRTVTALAARGGLLIANPAWHFLRVYHALFMRITLGASRLQEVMADYFAAVAYGPRAFTAGLSHVIKSSVEFARASNYLIERAEQKRQKVANLYLLPADAGLSAEDGASAVAEAMAAKGSPYDSHPPPSQRLAWISRLPGDSAAAGPDADAWSLFPSRAQLQIDMTTLVNDRLETAGLIDQEPIQPFVASAAAD